MNWSSSVGSCFYELRMCDLLEMRHNSSGSLCNLRLQSSWYNLVMHATHHWFCPNTYSLTRCVSPVCSNLIIFTASCCYIYTIYSIVTAFNQHKFYLWHNKMSQWNLRVTASVCMTLRSQTRWRVTHIRDYDIDDAVWHDSMRGAWHFNVSLQHKHWHKILLNQ